MELPKITRQQALEFVQDPKNYLLAPIIILGNALPYFFERYANGAYVDIISRSLFTAFEYSLTAKITPAIHPTGEKIRAHLGNQVNHFIRNLDPTAESVIKGLLLPACGIDPENLFSDEVLTKTALSTAALATALFTTSILTGLGVLPLFWAYQGMCIVRGIAAYIIDVYCSPQSHPLTWTAIAFIQEQIKQN